MVCWETSIDKHTQVYLNWDIHIHSLVNLLELHQLELSYLPKSMDPLNQDTRDFQTAKTDDLSTRMVTPTTWKIHDMRSARQPSPQAPAYSPIIENQTPLITARNEIGRVDSSTPLTDSQPCEPIAANNLPCDGTSKLSSDHKLSSPVNENTFQSSIVHLRSYEDWPMWFSQIRSRAFLLHVWEYINPFNEAPKMSLGEKPGVMGNIPLKPTEANWRELDFGIHWFCHDQRSLDIIDRFIDETVSSRYRRAIFAVPPVFNAIGGQHRRSSAKQSTYARGKPSGNDNQALEPAVSIEERNNLTPDQDDHGDLNTTMVTKQNSKRKDLRVIAENIASHLSESDFVPKTSAVENTNASHLPGSLSQAQGAAPCVVPRLKLTINHNDSAAKRRFHGVTRSKSSFHEGSAKTDISNRRKRAANTDERYADEHASTKRSRRQGIRRTVNLPSNAREEFDAVKATKQDEAIVLKEEEDAWERTAPITPHTKLRLLWRAIREERILAESRI